MKKFICKNCGSVNEASRDALDSNSDWLQSALLRGFEWTLPAGKITPIVGDPIYISGMGEHLYRAAYLNKYSIDPEIAYNLMLGNAVNRSALSTFQGQLPIKSHICSNRSAQNWLDEDDWTA
jgi:hypothetical protein